MIYSLFISMPWLDLLEFLANIVPYYIYENAVLQKASRWKRCAPIEARSVDAVFAYRWEQHWALRWARS